MTPAETFVLTFLANATWQVAGLALAAAAAGLLARRTTPGFQVLLWECALVLSLLTPLSAWIPSFSAEPIAAGFRLPAEGAAGVPAGAAALGMVRVAVWAWIVVSLVSLARLSEAWRLARRLRRSAFPDARCPAGVMATREWPSPATAGLLRPVVLIPESLLAAPPALVAAAVAHERAHAVRRDTLRAFAAEILSLPLMFHPAVWWLRSRLAAARELACDAIAAREFAAPADYGDVLLDAAKLISERRLQPGLPGLFDGGILEERLMHLVRPPRSRFAGTLAAASMSLLLASGGAIATRSVTFAQQEEEAQRAGGDVRAPHVLSKVVPQYTPRARDEKVEGTVVLYVEVSVEGQADQIRIVRRLHPDLDNAAVEAVRQWRFAPGTKNGKPVRVAAHIEINFRLLQ